MTTLYQRMPAGHPHLTVPASIGPPPYELPTSWAPFLQLIALAEQRVRQITREEHEHLLAEKDATLAEVDKHEQLLTVKQAAVVLGVIPQTVYEWIKAGKLPSRSPNGYSLRLKRSDVMSALQVRTKPDGRRKYARRTTKS